MNSAPKNLNECVICDEGKVDAWKMERQSARSKSGETEVFFEDIETKIAQHIRSAPAVVGCVAWLTSPKILDAMADCLAVSLVIQKEEFYTQKNTASQAWATSLRTMYNRIPSGKITTDFGGMGVLPFLLRENFEQRIEGVRCVGGFNRKGETSFPRMHHKFVVLCDLHVESLAHSGPRNSLLLPYAVLTGSFNYTKNASNSFENLVKITDEGVAGSYFREWTNMLALSEPLEWDKDEMTPEYYLAEQCLRNYIVNSRYYSDKADSTPEAIAEKYPEMVNALMGA